MNFCHDITGAIYLFWLGLFFACEFLWENCKGHHRSNLSIYFGGCVLLSWHCMSQLAIHINKLSIHCSAKCHESSEFVLSPFLTGRMFVRPNILQTLRRTMIRFLIEHLVRRIWFGQSRLYFILNWLVMRCKLRPELAADAQQTAWWKCRLKSSQVKSVYFNHPSQGNSTKYYLILGSPRQGCAFHKSTQVNK